MAEEKSSENTPNSTEDHTQQDTFTQELSKVPEEISKKLREKEKSFSSLVDKIEEKAGEKSMGYFITPQFSMQNGQPTPNYDNLSLNFLLDDFENPISEFNTKVLLGEEFNDFLTEKREKDENGEEYSRYFLKNDESIEFVGTSISMLRENCFDGIYDDLKSIGTGFVYKDNRGFISALKTIDIHRNMLLQKFEKYVVVYAGAGSWLRGEKSNDFDVYVVVDDTDVKRMPRMQVKDQLTRIIWQMSREVASITGIQLHIQVYLLTDFWEALKDAHPVMFTFLRDGVPFYDRGIYSAWKELLKLGKIKPSPEAIDMHMNVGTQLVDKAKKMFSDIVSHEIYNAVLSPSQAVLMLKGYNPTTPKETVKMFKDVLLAKEKLVSEKDVQVLENTVNKFKEIEHNKDVEITGKDVDQMLTDAEEYLKNIKNIFEEISEERTKESILNSYNELLSQVRTLPGFGDLSETEVFEKLKNEYVDTGKLPGFVSTSLDNISRAKTDYEEDKITVTEVNKVLKEIRNVLAEVKSYKNRALSGESQEKKLSLKTSSGKSVELFNYDEVTYLFDMAEEKLYSLTDNGFEEVEEDTVEFSDPSKYGGFAVDSSLFTYAKEVLGNEDIYL